MARRFAGRWPRFDGKRGAGGRRRWCAMNAHPTTRALADALRRIAGAAGVIGIAAVLVQAKDEAAKAWYLRQAEFMAFPEDGRVLWLPVEMVVWVGG